VPLAEGKGKSKEGTNIVFAKFMSVHSALCCFCRAECTVLLLPC